MKAEISKASMALIMIKKYLILIFFLISRIFATATYSSTSPAVSSFEPRVLTLFVSLAIGPSNKSVNRLSLFADNGKDMFGTLAEIGERGADLVSLREGIDTRGGQGQCFFALCRALNNSELFTHRREGIERAKAEGRYKGRKPIAVDESLFNSVVTLWQNGQITAREAMARLDLKPNTFYRRIKEMEELKMKDYMSGRTISSCTELGRM